MAKINGGNTKTVAPLQFVNQKALKGSKINVLLT